MLRPGTRNRLIFRYCRLFLRYSLVFSALGGLFIPLPGLALPAGNIASLAVSLASLGPVMARLAVRRYNREVFALYYHLGYLPDRLFLLGWGASGLAALGTVLALSLALAGGWLHV